jgi:DNA-binding beta-propeller fold protein YncE
MNLPRSLDGRTTAAVLLAVSALALSSAGDALAACDGAPGCPYRSVGVLGADPPTGHGVFRFPQAIAFSPGGAFVYVADQYSGIVQKFDRQGNWSGELGSWADAGQFARLGTIGGLATDRAHHLYVLDSENDRVQVFSSDTGDWLGAWGSTGQAPGRFDLGQNTGSGGIAVYQASAAQAPVVFIADQLNHRIQRFTPSQTGREPSGPILPAGSRDGSERDYVPAPQPDKVWGGFGDCSAHGCNQPADRFLLNFPQGVAVGSHPDGSGRTLVYVADDDNHRVVVYTTDGDYVAEVGSLGTGDGQFRFPYDVGVDDNNLLYVADNNNHRVQKFDAFALSFLGAWGGFGPAPSELEFPRALAALADDPLGGVYVADTANNRVQGFDQGGALKAAWGIAGRGARYVTRPGGLAVDRSGVVYVADTWDHRIEMLAPDGSYLGQFGYISARSGYAAPNTGNGQFQYPHGVAIDPASGDIWVSDSHNNRVQAFSPGGSWRATYGGLTPGSGPGQFDLPLGITTDASGNVYVADSQNNRVVKRDASTGGWSTVSLHGATLSAPAAVAVDGAGVLYVAESNRILRVSSTATSEVAIPAGGLDHPAGLWLSGSSLYVSDTGHDRVLRKDLESGVWTTFGDEGSGAGSFVAPLGLATDADGGVLYVADQLNNRIELFRISALRPQAAIATSPPTAPAPALPRPSRTKRLRIEVLRHRLHRQVLQLTLRCSEACRITVIARLRLRGSATSLRLRTTTRRLRAGLSSTVRLRLTASARRLVGRARAKQQTLSAKVSLLAVGSGGAHSRRTAAFRL